MGKIERWGMVLAVVLFVALIYMTVTDSSSGQVREVRKVSVVVDDADVIYWQNFKSGAEKAASELNLDISFNTLAEKGNVLQQKQGIEREVENGAEVLVVSPADTNLMGSYLESLSEDVPMVTTGSYINGPIQNIGADYYASGQLLAEHLIQEYAGSDYGVAVFSYTGTKNSHNDIYDGMEAVLNEAGISSAYVHSEADIYMSSFIRRQMQQQENQVIVCLDTMSAEIAVATFAEKEFPIYGYGYNERTLYYLENGQLEGIVAHDMYLEGYLCVVQAAGQLEKGSGEDYPEMNSYLLFPEDVYDDQYQQLLFPIS